MARFVYFDEVKPNPNSFPDYLIAGFSVSADDLPKLVADFRATVDDKYQQLGVPEGTELHAQHVYHGKAEFNRKDLNLRLELVADVLRLLEPDNVRLVYSRVRVANLYNASSALEYAFMHFCERAHNTLQGADLGMMIGDLDRGTRNELWKRFAHYRRNGTSWAFGQYLPKFVDSVHFVDSRVCELVQIADVYAFQCSNDGQRRGYPNRKLTELVADVNLFPTSYKDWPLARR